MTPVARYAAAIEVLDRIVSGEAAERALTNWARGHRFAGSKDRAAIRDHVFDALRRRRSYAALGGGTSGRALILGALREAQIDPDTVFSTDRFAAPPLTAEERSAGRAPHPGAEAADCPDWLWDLVQDDLGDASERVFACQRDAAPVGLRVNLAKTDRDSLVSLLAVDGVLAQPDPRSPSALVLDGRPRGLTRLQAWHDGLFELQDAGSQWVSDQVPLADGQTMVDFCAGGGGKTLAVAGRVRGRFVAHDGEAHRMKDLPERAERAGVFVKTVANAQDLPQADTVVLDVPCSGSGTWRRAPDAKWALTAQRLDALTELQGQILRQAAVLVRPKGHLVYATCSVLTRENAMQIADFLGDQDDFTLLNDGKLLPDAGSDGYYCAVLQRK